MHLKCSICEARFYSASDVEAGSRCGVPKCPGVLAIVRNGRLTLVK